MRLMLKSILNCLCLTFLVFVSRPATAQNKLAPPGSRTPELEGPTWQIANFQNLPSRGLRHKAESYLKFESGMIEGSPGCGRFTGIYRKSDEQLMISTEWRDRKETPCDDEEKEVARQVREALSHVQRIQAEPPYWRSDALLLTDAEGSIQITLAPMRAGADLSELEDTFWHLEKLYGSHADFSGVIVNIGGSGVGFSTSSHFISFPFKYRWAGLEFYPASTRITETKDNKFSQDQQIAGAFENTLHKIQSYELSQGSLAFFDKNRRPIMVLSDFRKEGIEFRRWRIAKCRGDGTQPADEDGLVDTKLAEITFLNGHVRGSPGCGGWWGGKYTLSSDHLTVKASFALFGTCDPEEFAQAHLVENALQGDLRVAKKGDRIILRDNSGHARILLVPY